MNGLIPNYYEGKLSGEVLLDGKNISSLPLYETAKYVGSVFQNPRTQFFTVDTTSELAFGCENQGLPEEEIIQRVTSTAEQFGMENLLGKNIFSLSGGEKQKIACASVSTSDPPIIVLDEPSSNPVSYTHLDVYKRQVYLFQDTIGNNIRYGRENATQEEIEAAAKLAQDVYKRQAVPAPVGD